ncbi:MAG: tail fiber domain-containing protein [Deltaproteobacteria bacterium]|nr:tail fiber domain-containing protein [Deltaproteobacteria bacterium]
MRKVFVAFAACLLVAAPAAAEAPAYLPVQGFLADAEGLPVDGDMTIRFALYTADLGGVELWNETQVVPVDQGFFTVYLGDVTVLDLAGFRDHDGLWLGVRVGADPEMARFQIATTGYAAFAQYAGDAATLGGTPAADFLTSATPIDWADLSGVPAGFADGSDDGASYTAGTGLTLAGTTFAADRPVFEGWAQGVCYDTEAELTAALDDNYAALAHAHAWGTLTGVPAGFADGVDDTGSATYTAGAGLTLTGTAFSVNFAGSGAAATSSRSDHNHDTTYVNEGQADSVSSAMVAADTLTAADIATGGCGSLEVFGTAATNAVLHYGPSGLLGQANTWQPYATPTGGVWIEGSDGESGGFFADGNMAAIWSPTDSTVNLTDGTVVGSTLLALYDEDLLPGTTPFNTATFVFSQGDTRRIAANNGAYLSSGGIWTNTSDRALKEDFEQVDPQAVLDRLASLPITEWSYKNESENGSFRHMGPMAQDFHAAFGLGYDERSIPTADADGVAVAAIQALHRRNEDLARRNADLEARIQRLEAAVEALAAGR